MDSLHSVEHSMKPTRDEQAFAELLDGMSREAPRQLARMAALADALQHARPATAPAPAFRNALRNRLIAETALRRPWFEGARDAWLERNTRMRRSFRFVFANAVAAIVLLAGGSILAVAEHSVPGDWDYFAKRLHEDARLLVTRAPAPRADLQMSLARERLNEVRELINRGDGEVGHYTTALDDMDARTLAPTEILVKLFRDTGDLEPLGRLTGFASAQRQGLEVLVNRLPPGARIPAQDSIDILERVSERVTGIMGGCICPANPLLPKSGGPSGSDPGDGIGTTGPQAPVCACAQFRGEDKPDGMGPREPGNGNPPPGGGDEPPPPGGDVDEPIDLPELPVVGDDIDDVVNGVIDQVLEPIVGPSPIPTISVPPLGVGLGG
jgi:hypothetical protein